MQFEVGGTREYREQLSRSADVPLWQQPWWLDATCGGPHRWRALSLLQSGQVVAGLAYVPRRRGRVLQQWLSPSLTQRLGPYVQGLTTAGKNESLERSALRSLAQLIPRDVFYAQSWSVHRTNWLPFYWEGFSQTTRYTHRLDLTQGDEPLWRGMAKSARQRIRQAERHGLVVRETQDFDAIIDLIGATYARQGLASPNPPAFLRRVYEAARARDACTLWVAETAEGRPAAGALLVRDATTSYALASGIDYGVAHAGAQRLVDWHSIRAQVGRSETFDFAGSMIEGIDGYLQSFGTVRVPYFYVYGSRSPWVRRLLTARTLAR